MLSEFKKPIANIAGMGSALQGVVNDYNGDFKVMRKRQTILKTLTLGEVVSFSRKLLKTNRKRLAVLYVPKGVQHDLKAAPRAYTVMRAPKHPNGRMFMHSYGSFV